MNVNPFSYLIEKLKSKVSKSGDTMNGNLTINNQDGTPSIEGYSYLILGNDKATGTDKNSTGILDLFGDTGDRVRLYALSPTATRYIGLPDKGGTVALTSDFNSLDCTSHTFSNTLAHNTSLTLLTYTATKNEYKNIFATVRFKADGASVTANHGIYNVKMKINGNTVIEEQHGFVEKTYYTASLSGVLPLKTGDVVTVIAVENNGVSIPIDGSLWY